MKEHTSLYELIIIIIVIDFEKFFGSLLTCTKKHNIEVHPPCLAFLYHYIMHTEVCHAKVKCNKVLKSWSSNLFQFFCFFLKYLCFMQLLFLLNYISQDNTEFFYITTFTWKLSFEDLSHKTYEHHLHSLLNQAVNKYKPHHCQSVH